MEGSIRHYYIILNLLNAISLFIIPQIESSNRSIEKQIYVLYKQKFHVTNLEIQRHDDNTLFYNKVLMSTQFTGSLL